MDSDYIIYGSLVAVFVILGYSIGTLTAEPMQNSQNNAYLTKTTGSTEDNDVQIDITPRGIVNGNLAFDFAANTHSVDMDNIDLKKIISLNFDGKNYAPIFAPKLSGHHNSGQIVFDLQKIPKSYSIIITGIPSQNQRIFQWP